MDREALEKPFAQELIQTVQMGRQPRRDPPRYVSFGHYLRRLNDGFDGRWSFEVVDWQEREGAEVIVRGRLEADGVVKEAFGGARVKKRQDGTVLSLGDDLKAAASDALKKCAQMLGVGLDINTEREPEERSDEELADEQEASTTVPPKEDRVTPAMLESLHELAKQLGVSPTQLAERAHRQYNRPTPHLTKGEAEELRTRMEVALRMREDDAEKEAGAAA